MFLERRREAGAPLVVALHGCTQTAAAMESAGWNALADQYQFAVLYPQQRSANNGLLCFTWFTPEDIARGGGEAASIMQMVDTAIGDEEIPDRDAVIETLGRVIDSAVYGWIARGDDVATVRCTLEQAVRLLLRRTGE